MTNGFAPDKPRYPVLYFFNKDGFGPNFSCDFYTEEASAPAEGRTIYIIADPTQPAKQYRVAKIEHDYKTPTPSGIGYPVARVLLEKIDAPLPQPPVD